jgi:hypothetical protein
MCKTNFLISYSFVPKVHVYISIGKYSNTNLSQFVKIRMHTYYTVLQYLQNRRIFSKDHTVLIPLISTIINGTLLNFGKRYEDDLRVIFDQWPKLHLVLDVQSNQKILNSV